MRYISTRGAAPALSFADALLAGLAPDGGLYVPESYPHGYPRELARTGRYAEVAVEIMWPFVDGAIDRDAFEAIVEETYATFSHPDVVPLKDLGNGIHLLELFHGPTLAFKDVALQLVGRLFDHVLTERGERITIVGATSGDTGSAAIEACRDRDAIDIVILHPAGRTSEVQRRQMTTVDASNVHNVAIDGTFDDCQDLVKAMFGDVEFRDDVRLGAVNSINWARVMAQVVYHVVGAERAGGGRPVAMSVPTGNFGNVFAGHVARHLGAPIGRFIVASNTNDILTRFFSTGQMVIEGVVPTLSPSMDIQVSSNLERLLFDVFGRDGAALAEAMLAFRSDGRMEIDADQMALLSEAWQGARFDDDATLATIGSVDSRHGELLDPHTAVGYAAAAESGLAEEMPVVVLGTAHPAKFPDAVEEATGRRPELPPHLADLFDRPERYDTLPNDLAVVQNHVRAVRR